MCALGHAGEKRKFIKVFILTQIYLSLYKREDNNNAEKIPERHIEGQGDKLGEKKEKK